MKRRLLGRTGLSVTPICCGGSPLGSMPESYGYSVPPGRAQRTLDALFASPINFLDTAAEYGDGESERRIGEALRRIGGLPEGFVLATKADRDLETGSFSREQMRRSVDGSIERLGLERLGLVYLHDPELTTFDETMAADGAVPALVDLKVEGLIAHLGVAGGPVDLMIRYVETDVFDVVLTHSRFTLIDRSATPLLDVAERHGVAVVNAAPYGSGILAKGRASHPHYGYREADADMARRVDGIATVCESFGVPVPAAALQFSLREPRVTSTVVGMSRPERVAETLRYATQPIPEELWEELEEFALPTSDPRADGW